MYELGIVHFRLQVPFGGRGGYQETRGPAARGACGALLSPRYGGKGNELDFGM